MVGMSQNHTEPDVPPATLVDAREGFIARYHMTPADELFDALVRAGHLTLKAYVEYAQRYEG
jgi:hypothetical protein